MSRPPKFIEADQIVFIDDYIEARRRPLETILGAVFHSREPATGLDKVAGLRAAYMALQTLDEASSLRYTVVVMSIAPPLLLSEALSELRSRGELEQSRYELFSDVERGGHSFHRGREEGREEGRSVLRGMLIRILQSRGFEPDGEMLSRIEACMSSTQLERCCQDALTVESLQPLIERLEAKY